MSKLGDKDFEKYIHFIVKDSKNNMEKYLFTENERLNAIIDELEDKIDKSIEYIKKTNKIHNEQYGYNSLLCDELLEILGDKE